MTSTPPGDTGPHTGPGPDTDPGPADEPGTGPSQPDGPRVTREELKDLARIRRSSTDKKVAGVAAGIARHLDIDPLVVRIGFVVLAFFGGGGILLYGVCWLFVPDERTNQAVVNVDGRSRTVILAVAGVIGALAAVGDSLGGFGFPWPVIVLLGIAAVLVLTNRTRKPHPGPLPAPATSPGPPPPPGSGGPQPPSYDGYQPPRTDPRKRGPVLFWFSMVLAAVATGVLLSLHLAGVDVPVAAYPAAVVAACGVMLLVGAFYGRAGGLIPIGLVAALLTVLFSAVPEFPDGRLSMGQTQVSPERLSDLSDSYAVGMGEIKIDLTETDLEGAGDEDLDLDVGMGHIEVLVPEDGLAVEVSADIGVGEIKVFDDKYTGSIEDEQWGEDGDPVLTINADNGVGNIEIKHEEGASR